MRTIADISENLRPLDDAIDSKFIPALFGSDITDRERDILSLPIRDGGMGIRKVSSNADSSFKLSSMITGPLTTKILQQSDDLPDAETVEDAKSDALHKHKSQEKENNNIIKVSQEPAMQRTIEQLSEPGASSWLAALPLESHSFNLTKAEFQDGLALRYNKQVKNLPTQCPCGATFNVTHALNCHKGGFVNIRHDSIRDLECALLKSVGNDVECEPPLQPVVNKTGYQKSAILDDGARLDVRARGFWRGRDKTPISTSG